MAVEAADGDLLHVVVLLGVPNHLILEIDNRLGLKLN